MRAETERADPDRGLRPRLEREDRHPHLRFLVLAGGCAAAFLVVVGLPPVWYHGPLFHLGVMTPVCGGTRSVAAVLHGELGVAWVYNPAGPFVVAGGAALLLRHAVGRSTGRWLNLAGSRGRVMVVVGILLVGLLWAHQQANAELLMEGADAFGRRLGR